jgi:hypothetical protein
MAEATVTITKKEYDSLVKDSRFLSALEAAGIDNVEAYSHGWRIFAEWYPEYSED